MHDYHSKRRDLRRAFLAGDKPKLYDLFERINPEYNRDRVRWNEYGWRQWLDICQNAEDDWISKTTGAARTFWGAGNAPAWFRRKLNRHRRTKEKQALRCAFLNDDWEDFTLSSHRNNANWLWF